MAETLYRKNEDGSFELVEQKEAQKVAIPEARSKSAARDRWLAQMGTLRKDGKRAGTFSRGKMRGKTYDQANQQFEAMWESAPESVREQYAARGRGGATKSEIAEASGVAPTPKVTNATLNATKPGETTAQAHERFRQSRTGVKPTPEWDRDSNGTPDSIQRPKGQEDLKVAGTPITEAAIEVGTPEERAKVQAMVNEGAGLATATVGNYLDMRSAVAADRGDPDLMGVNKEIRDRDNAALNAQAKKDAAAEVARVQAKQDDARAKAGLPASAAGQPAPASNIGKRTVDVGSPVTPGMSTDDRMIAQGKASHGDTPVVKTPATVTNATPAPTRGRPEPTRSALIATPDFTPGEGKEMTGMSAGRPTYSSADSLYGKAKPSISNTIANTPAGADPTKPVMVQGQTVEQRRADYQAREAPRAAGAMAPARQTATTPAMMPRGPASQPERVGSSIDNPNSAFSDAAYARTAAAQKMGVETTAISSGTASNETRAKHPELVKRITEDTAAMAGLSSVRPPASSRVVATRQVTAGGTPATQTIVPGVRPTPPQFNPTNSSRPAPIQSPSRVMPAQPRKPVLPGLTRPVFAMANR